MSTCVYLTLKINICMENMNGRKKYLYFHWHFLEKMYFLISFIVRNTLHRISWRKNPRLLSSNHFPKIKRKKKKSLRSGLVFKTNGCSSGTAPCCAAAAQESINSWNGVVVWQIAQLDTLTEMPNETLHVIFQGQPVVSLGFRLPPRQNGSSATVLHVSPSSASAQKETIRGTVSSALRAVGRCHLTWTRSFSSFLL